MIVIYAMEELQPIKFQVNLTAMVTAMVKLKSIAVETALEVKQDKVLIAARALQKIAVEYALVVSLMDVWLEKQATAATMVMTMIKTVMETALEVRLQMNVVVLEVKLAMKKTTATDVTIYTLITTGATKHQVCHVLDSHLLILSKTVEMNV